MDELVETLDWIESLLTFSAMIYLFVLFGFIAGLVYFILERNKEKKSEQFEKRKW